MSLVIKETDEQRKQIKREKGEKKDMTKKKGRKKRVLKWLAIKTLAKWS